MASSFTIVHRSNYGTSQKERKITLLPCGAGSAGAGGERKGGRRYQTKTGFTLCGAGG